MRTFIVGIVVGAVLVLVLPPIVRELSVTTPTTEATASPTRAATAAPATTGGVAGQLAALDRALAQAQESGKAVSVTLSFTERDLTGSAATYFPQTISGVTLSDPAVRLRAGQIVLDMNASAAFIRSTASVTATVAVANGRPATTIVSATVGGAQLPQSVTGAVTTQLDQALAAGLPAKFIVTTIAVGSGVLIVTGTANP